MGCDPAVTYHPLTGQWEVLTRVECHGVAIPAGFLCDLSSVPRLLWALIAPFELSISAPLVHDYLYRNGGLGRTRAEVDALFLSIMEEEGVSWWRRRAAYYAVRLFGGKAFRSA